jgi:Nucleosome assembly protein (NAP)
MDSDLVELFNFVVSFIHYQFTVRNANTAPEEPADDGEKLKGIPGFWAQCLVNHPAIQDIITQEDIPALESITNITCDYNEDYTSFTLSFYFAENEFFTNTLLKKTYMVSPDLLDEKSPVLTGHETSEIEWKPSKNLCMEEIKKKQKAKAGKNKGQVRTITKLEPKASFFQFFNEPSDDDEEEEDEDEDEDKPRIKLSVEEDYDIGHAIRTAIIPEAILWFTGEAVEDEDDDDAIDYEGQEDDDEDDEDEDDDEAEGRKGKARVTAKPGGGFAAAPGATGPNGEQPECKQN